MESMLKVKISKWHWFFVLFTAAIAFLFFDQTFDMKITMLHEIYLLKSRVRRENFLNFYNYAMDKSLRGEYIRGGGYPGCGAIYWSALIK